VVLEEIRRSMTTQIGSDSRLSESVYQHHPYGRSVLGTEPELKHSPEAMRCFHRAHYQPENMTVVIVGELPKKLRLRTGKPDSSSSSRSGVIVVLLRRGGGETSAGWNVARIVRCCWSRRVADGLTGPGVDQIRGYGLDLLSVLLSEGELPPSADVTGRTAIGPGDYSNFRYSGVKFIYD